MNALMGIPELRNPSSLRRSHINLNSLVILPTQAHDCHADDAEDLNVRAACVHAVGQFGVVGGCYCNSRE